MVKFVSCPLRNHGACVYLLSRLWLFSKDYSRKMRAYYVFREKKSVGKNLIVYNY